MSNLVQRRDRIARVRRIEHVLAAGAVAETEAQLESLQESAERVLNLRLTLTAGVGSTDAWALAAQGELAHRLDIARFGLSDAIATARATLEVRNAERIEARIRQESADKLRERAAVLAAEVSEQRLANSFRMRPRKSLEGDD
jgi:hypothetical protein